MATRFGALVPYDSGATGVIHRQPSTTPLNISENYPDGRTEPDLSCPPAFVAENRGRRILLAAAIASLAAGCTTLLMTPQGDQVLRAWRGRYALNVLAADTNAQNSSGSFTLTEAKRLIHFELLSPLGATLASAQVDGQSARLMTADGRRFEAPTAEELTEQLFGWRIPVQRLPNWFEGQVEHVNTWRPDDQGKDRPFEAEDAGWQIRFEQWNGERIGRIVMRYPDRVELRMVIPDAR